MYYAFIVMAIPDMVKQLYSAFAFEISGGRGCALSQCREILGRGEACQMLCLTMVAFAISSVGVMRKPPVGQMGSVPVFPLTSSIP
jgi:hypothetical protein